MHKHLHKQYINSPLAHPPNSNIYIKCYMNKTKTIHKHLHEQTKKLKNTETAHTMLDNITCNGHKKRIDKNFHHSRAKEFFPL